MLSANECVSKKADIQEVMSDGAGDYPLLLGAYPPPPPEVTIPYVNAAPVVSGFPRPTLRTALAHSAP